MRLEGFDGVVFPRKLGLGQRGVYFPVANMMEKHGWPSLATFQFRDEMMDALFDIMRNRSLAQRANWVWHALAPSAAIGQKLADGVRRERAMQNV